jgi:hypothetical protein
MEEVWGSQDSPFFKTSLGSTIKLWPLVKIRRRRRRDLSDAESVSNQLGCKIQAGVVHPPDQPGTPIAAAGVQMPPGVLGDGYRQANGRLDNHLESRP